MQNENDNTYTYDDGNPTSETMVGELQDESSEQKILTNISFSFLTAEAKFVLYAVMQVPGELSQMLFKNKVTPNKIKKYLRLMGWQTPIISKTIRELRVFSKDLTVD